MYENRLSVQPALVLGLSTVLLMITSDFRVLHSFPLDGRSAVVVFNEDIGIYLVCRGNISTPVVLNASLHDLQHNASRWTSKTVNFCDDFYQANSQDGFHPHLVYFRKQIMGGMAITIGVSSTAITFTPVNETHLLQPFGPWETAEQEMLLLKATQGCPMFSSFKTGTGRTGRIIYKFRSGKQDFAVVTELAQQGGTESGINSIVGGTGLFLMTNRCEGQELIALTCNCHGHPPLLMNATAANAEFDNGQLLLYVAFVSSVPDQLSTKSRFVCSFDIFNVLNTTAGGFDAEQKSLIPRQKLCTAVFSEGHVAEILATRIDAQIIILYRNQHTVYLLSQVQSRVKQPSFTFFTSENSKIRAMAISNKNVAVDILTEEKLVRLPLNSCSSYSTCDQCMVARMDNCGWCILENKCTIRQTCFRLNITLTDQRNFWLNAHRGVRASSCPTIRHMHSSFYASVRTSSKTDHLVKLTLARYPDFGIFNLVVICVFPRRENHKESDQTLPVWYVTTNDHPVIECPIPVRLRSSIWLSPGHPFYDHQTVLIQVTDGQQSSTIATVSMIVYKSCDQLSCSECLSLYPTCGWTFRNGTVMCRSRDNNTTQMVTCEAPDATGRTPAADSIDSIKPVVLENNPTHGPLAEETVIRFTGQNLLGTLAVFVGKDECVIISRDSSSLNCSIQPDASVYEIGNVTLYIADTIKGELRCKNCSFAFTGKRWKALSTVVPGFPLGTDQELIKVDETNSGTILVGSIGGAVLAVCCFFSWTIWQSYRKSKKIKIDIERRRKRVSQRLRQQDLCSLCENVRSVMLCYVKSSPLTNGKGNKS